MSDARSVPANRLHPLLAAVLILIDTESQKGAAKTRGALLVVISDCYKLRN